MSPNGINAVAPPLFLTCGPATEDNNDKAPSALSSHKCNTETHLSRKQLRKRPAEFMKGKFTLTSNPRISNKAEI